MTLDSGKTKKISAHKISDRLPSASRSGLSRRFFLGAGSLAAAAIAAPAASLASSPSSSESEESNTLVAQKPALPTPTAYRYRSFNEPHVIVSNNGEINEQFSVNITDFEYECEGQSIVIPGRHYGTYLPGPTLLVNPGDKIKIELSNDLPDDDASTSCPGSLNTPMCYNTTNLHFHGLHVSPQSYCVDGENVLSSDDVLLEIEPGETHNWCVWLPEFHAPGTHWYHAHKHGSTALQVSNGMAGAIVIREPFRNQIVNQADDKVWVIQEILPCDGTQQDCDDAVYDSTGSAIGGTPGVFLVNGECQPTLNIQAGKLQRWRFINATATPRGLMSLKLCKCIDNSPTDTSTDCSDPDLVNMYLMAVDGISFYGKPPEAIGPDNTRNPKWTEWQFSPGNRADFLIKLDAASSSTSQWYKLIKDNNPGATNPNNTAQSATEPQILAYIKVQPSIYDDEIPSVIPGTLSDFPYLTPISRDDLTNVQSGQICPRSFEFSGQGRQYQINGQKYCPECINVEVELGTAEEWALSHSAGSAHPFHIHVNPFQIVGDLIDPAGQNIPSNWRWWDTIALYSTTSDPLVQPVGQATTSNPIRTRQWFFDYPGDFVIHCHILTHEDQGMMMNVRVNGSGTEPCHSLAIDGSSEPGDEIPVGAVVCQGDNISNALCPPEGSSCDGTNADVVDTECP